MQARGGLIRGGGGNVITARIFLFTARLAYKWGGRGGAYNRQFMVCKN